MTKNLKIFHILIYILTQRKVFYNRKENFCDRKIIKSVK